MSKLDPSKVMMLGLFEKRIEGDDCLLELAHRRFQQAGMGTEFHADTLENLERMMKFRSSENSPVIVHLPRDLHLTEEQSQKRILDFATHFARRVWDGNP